MLVERGEHRITEVVGCGAVGEFDQLGELFHTPWSLVHSRAGSPIQRGLALFVQHQAVEDQAARQRCPWKKPRKVFLECGFQSRITISRCPALTTPGFASCAELSYWFSLPAPGRRSAAPASARQACPRQRARLRVRRSARPAPAPECGCGPACLWKEHSPAARKPDLLTRRSAAACEPRIHGCSVALPA